MALAGKAASAQTKTDLSGEPAAVSVAATLIAVVIAVLSTSFLSGIFGMLGGLILMGLLLLVLPVPAAMSLHAVTQMTSNGWRALLWHRLILWRVMPGYIFGSSIAFGILAWVSFQPPTAWVYIGLGWPLPCQPISPPISEGPMPRPFSVSW